MICKQGARNEGGSDYAVLREQATRNEIVGEGREVFIRQPCWSLGRCMTTSDLPSTVSGQVDLDPE